MNRSFPILIVVIGLWLVLAACRGGETRFLGFTVHHGYDTETGYGRRIYTDLPYSVVFNCCVDTFWELDLPIAEARPGEIRSRRVAGGGISWTLCVKLMEKEESIEVSALLEVERESEWESRHLDEAIDHVLGVEEVEDEAADEAARKEKDRVRIRRVTDRVTRFFPLLDDRVADRGGRLMP